ncbi:MAG: hypothetical protein QF578_17465 [Alphaproteobacteria bacterium]|jgi:hypothetical protein|nr:hypothetical protein [Alphaproteobacteria bacterium]MDP6566620.1 hypothetical protein [Alphaproteobacteria bacterium]MDP6815048.1 hypothetical protein [Alphaproteobacteria bacterium]
MAADWTENTKALKLLVGGMTALLVIGLILLLVGMARTAGEMSATLGDLAVRVDPGDQLIDIAAGDGRLYLTVRQADGGQAVIVLDADSGRRLGRLRLEAGE